MEQKARIRWPRTNETKEWEVVKEKVGHGFIRAHVSCIYSNSSEALFTVFWIVIILDYSPPNFWRPGVLFSCVFSGEFTSSKNSAPGNIIP